MFACTLVWLVLDVGPVRVCGFVRSYALRIGTYDALFFLFLFSRCGCVLRCIVIAVAGCSRQQRRRQVSSCGPMRTPLILRQWLSLHIYIYGSICTHTHKTNMLVKLSYAKNVIILYRHGRIHENYMYTSISTFTARMS